MTQKPRKGDFRELKSKNFPYGACPRTPLEACAFGARLGNFYSRSASVAYGLEIRRVPFLFLNYPGRSQETLLPE